MSSVLLRFDKNDGYIGICLLVFIPSECLKYFLIFRKCVLIKRPAAHLDGVFVRSGEHIRAPSSVNSHGCLVTAKTHPATEKVTRIPDKTSTYFTSQPRLTCRQDDTNFCLKTEGNVTVYKAVQM